MSADSAILYTAVTPSTFTTFGTLLLFLRRRARLRQRDLAIAVGYSEAQIGRLENDQRTPDVAVVMAQFIPALEIEHEPELAERLIELAQTARLPADTGADVVLAASNVAADSPEDATPVRIGSELPHHATPLLGREPELARLATLLATPGNRCVTLIGPGGVGKTRLAMRAAQQNAPHFAQGVCAVALTSVASGALLAPAIARTLGLVASAKGDVVTELHAYLRDKHMLLLLDNMEHLVESADLLAHLLAAAPRVHLLATSRERLQLQGEITLDVAGLLLPPTKADADALAANPAVTLFCSTAQRLRADRPASPTDMQAAARVCRLVEGLPLAIELAAGWANLLAFDEIERELRQTLDFLQTGLRDLPPRHRSLRAAFAHSWDMLAAAEQRALGRLSVFRGSFGREAAHAVLYDQPTTQPSATTLHVLGALADKSLLRRGDGAGATRFVLHELVRQYAAEQLRGLPQQEQTTQASHTRYYLDLLIAQEQRLRGPEQIAALATLATEADQIRAALQSAIAEADVVTLRAVLPALATWFEWTYAMQEGQHLFQQISVCLQEQPPPAEHVVIHQEALTLALTHAGWFNFHATEFELAFAQLHQAHALAKRGDNWLVLGDTLLFLGAALAESGDTTIAKPLLLACMRAYASCGDGRRVARGAYRLGSLLLQNGEYVRALHLAVISVDRLRPVGDLRALVFCLNRLGMIHALLGRYTEAEQCFQESLLHCATTGDQRSMASALLHMGSVAQHRADHTTARYFFQESLQIFSVLNERTAIATVLALAGYSAVLEQDYAAARDAFDATWRIVRDADIPTVALLLVVGLGALSLARGQAEQAVEAFTLALHHAASEQSTRDRAAHMLREAEAGLTPYQFAAAQARGRSASLERVLAAYRS